MHEAAYAKLGIAARYLALRVAPADLGAALAGVAALGFRGVNLTVPHKQAALAHLHRQSDAVLRIGACNTIVCAGNVLVGHNTDAPGFVAGLRELGDRPMKLATVLGGGGAALGVIDGLLSAYPDLCIQWIAREPNALTIPSAWQGRLHARSYTDVEAGTGDRSLGDLLVNTTTVGMAKGPTEFPVELALDRLESGARVVDIVYPRPTNGLLDRAHALGFATQDGLAMLLWQGVLALEIWLETKIDDAVVEAMRATLR
jgi:shikimate dehydrogenase